MTCQLTVRTDDEIRQWEWDNWSVLAVIASLDADPRTLDELQVALDRYCGAGRLSEGGKRVGGTGQAARRSPWCLIDLVGRTVVGGGGFQMPRRSAVYRAAEEARGEVDDGGAEQGMPPAAEFGETVHWPTPEVPPVIWINVPPGWRLMRDGKQWQQRAAKRAQQAQRTEPMDVRPILFGRPLLEFLAERVLAAPADDGPGDPTQWLQWSREIHAAWLMTRRTDLSGRTPRQLLVEDAERVQQEMEQRAEQWSAHGEVPPPLPLSSPAYRFGSFGTIEVVLYFDMVRALLEHAFQVRQRATQSHEGRLDHSQLTRVLEEYRDDWLATPDEDMSTGMTPAEMIDSERQRIPLVSDAGFVDCDCPICMAEQSASFGPMFYWVDGHHLEMEDEFAFSLIPTRKEWEEQQKEFAEFSKQLDEKHSPQKGTSHPEGPPDPFDESVWQASYVNWEQVTGPDSPRNLGRMAIGFLLAELVADLRQLKANRSRVTCLNQTYVTFRTSDDPVAVRSAAEQLRQQLEEVGRDFPDLVAKSADLQSRLDEVLRQAVGTRMEDTT